MRRREPQIEFVVVFFLGSFAVCGLVGMLVFLFILANRNKNIPVEEVALLSGLSTLVGTALGALGSMLNQAHKHPDSVTIQNQPNDPVPVSQQSPVTPAPSPKTPPPSQIPPDIPPL